MKKAKDIYKSIIARDRSEMRTFGIEEHAVALTSKEWKMTARTINELEKINESEKRGYRLDVEKLGLPRDEVAEQAMKNMDLAIKAWRARAAEWEKILNS